MSDLSPESAPRRTFADHSGFMVHVLTIDDALALYETAGIPDAPSLWMPSMTCCSLFQIVYIARVLSCNTPAAQRQHSLAPHCRFPQLSSSTKARTPSPLSNALFDGATFSRSAWFFGARFACKCTFTSTELKSNASFEGTTFAIQPLAFFRAKLHEGTTWLDARWPPPPLSRNDAGSFVRL